MSVIDNALTAILRGSNPDASDEDIAAQVEGLKKSGGEAVNQALSFIPGMNSIKDIASNAGPLMRSDAGQTIARGVSGAPITDQVPNPGNPVSGLAQGALAAAIPSASEQKPAAPPAPMPEPQEPAPVAPPQPSVAPAATAKPMPPMDKPSMETPALPDMGNMVNDNDARNKALAEAEKNRKLSILPTALGGAADAIGSAASAFGVNAPTDKQDKLMALAHKNFDESKTLFDEKLKNDPNSDVSRAYRQMVTQIAPDMAKQEAFQKMSAQSIGDKLPLIDTMMKAQAQKDTKEMGLKQLQSNKDISLGLKESQQQDKLEQQYKQQLMSVRGDPNISGLEKQRDAAAQAYNLINDSKTANGGYNLSEPQMVELYGQLYSAMTGRGLTAEAQHAMDQATAKSKLASIATFIGMSPSATTQAIGDRLMHMTTTLGSQVQGNLDKRMEPRLLPPSGLDPKRADPIKKDGRGFTFQELMDQSHKRKSGSQAARQTKSGISYSVED